MKRYIYAIKDKTSGFADTIECVSDVPARYVSQVNKVNKMKPLPPLMAADLCIYCLGEVDDETLIVTHYEKPELVGDFKESILWLERKQKDAGTTVL